MADIELVIKISQESYNNLKIGCTQRVSDSEMIEALKNGMPLPKGYWIGHREHCENLEVMPSGLGAYRWCSECDCGIDVREWHRNHYNYCPNCGARMVEPQESEG